MPISHLPGERPAAHNETLWPDFGTQSSGKYLRDGSQATVFIIKEESRHLSSAKRDRYQSKRTRRLDVIKRNKHFVKKLISLSKPRAKCPGS